MSLPVDVEITANFLRGGQFRLNLVQCRPLQVKGGCVEMALLPAPSPRPACCALAEPRTGRRAEHERGRGPGRVRRPGRLRAGRPERSATRWRARRRPAHAARARRASPGSCCSAPGAGYPHRRARRADVVRGDPAGLRDCRDCEAGDEGAARRVARVALLRRFLVEVEHALPRVYPDRAGYRLHETLLRSEPNRLAELLPEDARIAEIAHPLDFPLRGDGRTLWLNAELRAAGGGLLPRLASVSGHVLE